VQRRRAAARSLRGGAQRRRAAAGLLRAEHGSRVTPWMSARSIGAVVRRRCAGSLRAPNPRGALSHVAACGPLLPALLPLRDEQRTR
jgi:hypothetical protein